jgi:hypothetical protein
MVDGSIVGFDDLVKRIRGTDERERTTAVSELLKCFTYTPLPDNRPLDGDEQHLLRHVVNFAHTFDGRKTLELLWSIRVGQTDPQRVFGNDLKCRLAACYLRDNMLQAMNMGQIFRKPMAFTYRKLSSVVVDRLDKLYNLVHNRVKFVCQAPIFCGVCGALQRYARDGKNGGGRTRGRPTIKGSPCPFCTSAEGAVMWLDQDFKIKEAKAKPLPQKD